MGKTKSEYYEELRKFEEIPPEEKMAVMFVETGEGKYRPLRESDMPSGSSLFNTPSPITVTTSPQQIIGENPNRKEVHLYVEGDNVYIGHDADNCNYKILNGEWITIPTTKAIYAKAESTSATIYIVEV